METTIASKQHILNSRGNVLSGGPLLLLINHPINMGVDGLNSFIVLLIYDFLGPPVVVAWYSAVSCAS
jgi:hypothetical protein